MMEQSLRWPFLSMTRNNTADDLSVPLYMPFLCSNQLLYYQIITPHLWPVQNKYSGNPLVHARKCKYWLGFVNRLSLFISPSFHLRLNFMKPVLTLLAPPRYGFVVIIIGIRPRCPDIFCLPTFFSSTVYTWLTLTIVC